MEDYYDNRYTPLEPNDLDDDSVLRGRNKKNTLKVLNKGYHTIFRNALMNNGVLKSIEIGVYGSGSHESPIRNAETGEFYKYKVGSMDEDLFYKVMICTGEFPNGPLTLFYNSPEHYERHQFVEVDNLHKKIWEEKKQDRLYFLDNQSKKSRI
jgi:hypothetical protein